jgi:SNF2 family DNA or RNA helicase
MLNFEFKTNPYDFQMIIWDDTKERKSHALFMEQGTGKSKVDIDTAAWLYCKEKVENLLVIAPSGVHRNWVKDEIPKHLPDNIKRLTHSYQTSKAKTRKHKEAIYDLMGYREGLSVLAMSYDSFMTKAGKETAWDFMKKKKLLYTLDESTRIKDPGAKRTEALLKSAQYADYKRILTGTPIANGPFDIWAPINFLDEKIWIKHKLSSYWVFKNYFGNIIRKKANLGHFYEALNTKEPYLHLDELYEILQPHSTRVLKADVLKDLPPKLYSTRYFELSKEQQAIYNEIEETYMVMVDGELWTMELALTRLLRLQQVTCGYLPKADPEPEDEPYTLLPGKNIRLEALKELCEDTPHQGIIWARFTKDVDLIMELLNSEGMGGAVRYDGQVNEDQRADSIDAFRAQEVQWFVGKASVGGEGLTLTEAKTVIYYNNTFKLIERLQSEDRAHRIGQDQAVLYYDIAAMNTVDEKIIDSLIAKVKIANTITGDQAKDWLTPREKEQNSLVTEAIVDALQIFGLN